MKAIVLDLVNPARPGRRLGGKGRDAGIDEAIRADAARHHGGAMHPSPLGVVIFWLPIQNFINCGRIRHG